jgi:hypothetical protein
MAGINTLDQIYKSKGDSFIKDLLDKFVIINETRTGSFFGLQNTNEGLKFFKKSGEITNIDRVLTVLYEKPIKYFNYLIENGVDIPNNLYFGFSYKMTSGDSLNIYLTYIKDTDNNKFYHTREVLNKWADIFKVGNPGILFEGKLNDDQKRAILDFIYTPYDNLIKQYRTRSFTKYILSVLGSKERDEDIDSIVFRFYDNDNGQGDAIISKLIDPVFQELTKSNKVEQEKPNDYVYIILMDLINYIETYRIMDLKSLINPNESPDISYLKIMNEIYKSFMDTYGMKYLDIKFNIPEFLSRKEFSINIDMIPDKKIKDLISMNNNFNEIYKILINFFRKKKKKTFGILSSDILLQFNSLVDKIHKIINNKVVYEDLFPSYEELTSTLSEDFNTIMGKDVMDTYNQTKRMTNVNIIIDYFQPITLDHIKSAELLKNKNKKPCVFVVLKDNIRSEKRPFKNEYIKKMMDYVKAEYSDLIIDVVYTDYNNIEGIINSMYPNYQPVLWGTNKSMLLDYALQFDYATRKNIKYNLKSSSKLIELPINSNCKEVIDSIKDKNITLFKSLMPQSLHSQFFNLQLSFENK